MSHPAARPVASNPDAPGQREHGTTDHDSLPPTGLFVRPASGRITGRYVEQVLGLLSERDRHIVADLARVRLLSGAQLDRLHFFALSPPARARSRVMQRLNQWRVTTTLDRRVGGVRAGSAGLIYTLDVTGQRLWQLVDNDQATRPARRPWTPGWLFMAHSLDISELYVGLREAERQKALELVDFQAEPACWQRTASLGTIKPDTFVTVAQDDIEDAWWIEVDRATESPNTIRRKLELYLLAAQTGQVGPSGVLPRVLITVPDTRRLETVTALLASTAASGRQLFAVVEHHRAVTHLARALQE